MNDKVIALIDMDCFYVQVAESNDQIEKKSNGTPWMYERVNGFHLYIKRVRLIGWFIVLALKIVTCRLEIVQVGCKRGIQYR